MLDRIPLLHDFLEFQLKGGTFYDELALGGRLELLEPPRLS